MEQNQVENADLLNLNDSKVKVVKEETISKSSLIHSAEIHYEIKNLSSETADFKSSKFFLTLQNGLITRWEVGIMSKCAKNMSLFLRSNNQLKIMSTVVGKLLNNNSLNLIPEFSNKLDYTFKHDKDNISLVIPISKIRQFIQGESVILSLQLTLKVGPATSPFKNEYSPTLKKILNDGLFSDFALVCGNQKVKVHKFVLAEKSLVFHSLLTAYESMTELDLENEYSIEVVQDLVNFLYNKNLESLDKNALKLIYAASKFGLDDLQKMCLTAISKNLKLENALDTLAAGHLFGEKLLTSQVFSFIEENIQNMIAVPKWIEFCRGNGEIVKPWILKFEVKFTRFILPTTFEAADEYISSKGEICDHYEKLFLTKAFADLQFEIAGKKLMAHKCILSVRSSIFENLCHLEASEIKIDDIEYEAFEELIRFLYCGKVTRLNSVALDLLVAASKYQLPELQEICDKYLRFHLNTDNCLRVLVVAEKYSRQSLKQRTIWFIGKNIATIYDTHDWKNLLVKHEEIFNQMIITWVKTQEKKLIVWVD